MAAAAHSEYVDAEGAEGGLRGTEPTSALIRMAHMYMDPFSKIQAAVIPCAVEGGMAQGLAPNDKNPAAAFPLAVVLIQYLGSSTKPLR